LQPSISLPNSGSIVHVLAASSPITVISGFICMLYASKCACSVLVI
jgi:hypothetical protein